MRREIDFDICEQILELIAGGNYPATACRAVGIDTSDLKRWLARGEANEVNDDPLYNEFYTEYCKAEAEAETKLVKTWHDAAITDPKIAEAFLAKRYKDRWASSPNTIVQQTTIAGELTDEQRKERIAELLAKKEAMEGKTVNVEATEVLDSNLLSPGTSGDFVETEKISEKISRMNNDTSNLIEMPRKRTIRRINNG